MYSIVVKGFSWIISYLQIVVQGALDVQGTQGVPTNCGEAPYVRSKIKILKFIFI